MSSSSLANNANGVRQLEPEYVQRIWGVKDLNPYFPDADCTEKIGEVWFRPSPDFPLLVKFLFTEADLSVQVHPDDAYAQQNEKSRGKTEMWHILSAAEGARIALGFKAPLTDKEIRAAAADGTLAELLNWEPVQAGDTLFAEAGVVHAIGKGIVLCEIQQNSDVTYRLFDYGRRRELHLDKGLQVMIKDTCQGRRDFPVSCKHFHTELLEVQTRTVPPQCSDALLVAIKGTGTINGISFAPGHVYLAPRGDKPVELIAEGIASFLYTRCGGSDQ